MIPQNRPAKPSTPRARRVSLSTVRQSLPDVPLRVLVHGMEGVGKTTFAAGAPAPIFLCPEDGIPRMLGQVAHFPTPATAWTWEDVIDAVRALIDEEHQYGTLVLDTLDWLEPLLFAHVCAANKWASIEEPGYGKGYTAAIDGWRVLIGELERLRAARGMHLVLLAHSSIRPFKNPEGDDYDRYELKVNAKAAGLWKEWCDCVLFARHDDSAAKDTKTKRVRGVSSGQRVLLTTHHAAYDAKNRYALPERLLLDWAEFYAHVRGDQGRIDEEVATLRESIAQLDPAKRKLAEEALVRAGRDLGRLAQLGNWVAGNLPQTNDSAQ